MAAIDDRDALEAVSLTELVYTGFKEVPPLKAETPAEAQGRV